MLMQKHHDNLHEELVLRQHPHWNSTVSGPAALTNRRGEIK